MSDRATLRRRRRQQSESAASVTAQVALPAYRRFGIWTAAQSRTSSMRQRTAKSLNLHSLSLYAVGVLRLVPLAVMIAWAMQEQPARLVVSVAVAGVVEACLLAAVFRTWRGFFLAGLPLFLFGSLYASYALMYGSQPGRSLAYILLTTSWEEIVGCLSLPQSRLPLLGLISVAALYLILSLRLAHGSRIDSDVKP